MEVPGVKGILGRKIGMTQVFDDEGRLLPVTVVEAGPCVVVQKKSVPTDGYDSIQVGFGPLRKHRVNRPLAGHFKKAGLEPRKLLREFRVSNAEEYKVGQEIKVDIFQPGERVDVTGTSRGKGFAGVIKRYNRRRGPMTHGSKYHRRVGTLGAATGVSRVFKGKKMPGRLGGERVTVRGLELVRVDAERNLLLVKGAVPGARGAFITIRSSVRGGSPAR